MTKSITRRAMLAAVPICCAAGQASRSNSKAPPFRSVGEFVRFSDPTTETPVVRLTSLASGSFLPAPGNRFVSIRERFLLFSSDRAGALSPFSVDLRNGMVRQLAETTHLDPASLCLGLSDQTVHFLDGGKLCRVELSKKRGPEVLGENISAFSQASPRAFFWIRNGNVEYFDGHTSTVLAAAPATSCIAAPGGADCIFAREIDSGNREFWYVTPRSKPRLLVSGAIRETFWASDGNSILFLRRVPKGTVTVSEIHEIPLDGSPEKLVVPTSQFASFSPNFDSSVFVGASQSKAQPNIVLVLRSSRSELTLCQHHSSAAVSVSPAFSPDAKRVYFQSDEEGKPAVYSVNVELLVEPKSSEAE